MPDWPSHVTPYLAGLRLSANREREIVEEISQHLEDRWRDLVAGGISDEEATRLLLAELSDGTLTRAMAPLRLANESPRITPGVSTRFLPGDLWRDTRQAIRVLRQRPGYAATVILTLALAIGATAAIFAVVDTTLLRSLPFPDPDRLVQVLRGYPTGFGTSASVPKFVRWRAEGRNVFEDVAAHDGLESGFNLVGSGRPERLLGSHVSAGFFDVMGVHPFLGRAFTTDEDVPGGPKVVILGHAVWRDRFGSDAAIVGRRIALNSESYTVVGVMPEGFQYPATAQLWTPFQFDAATDDRAHLFQAVGRLRPGVTLQQARAAMEIATGRIRRELPDLMEDHEFVAVRPFRDELYGNVRQPLLILLASVGFVLMIACVNIANLQLAQAAGRRHEITVRTALGASTPALVRQLLMEGIVLALIGAIAGVALAHAAVPALLALSPASVPYLDRIGVDWRVLGFALGVSVLASLAFGLLPAWHAARSGVGDVLRAGTVRVAGQGWRTARHALIAGEVALALMLTIGAVLLVKSLVLLQATPPGFEVDGVLTMRLALPEARYGKGDTLARFHEQVEERIGAVPGVRAAAVAHMLPLQPGGEFSFTIEGRYVAGTDSGVGAADFRPISPRYFEALEIPVRRGRAFGTRDRRGAVPVVIINDAAARKFWPGEDPVGRRITVGQPSEIGYDDPTPREIIGVVGDVRERGLGIQPYPALYVPISQLNDTYAALGARLFPYSVVVRGDAGPDHLARPVQQAIWSIDPQQPITEVGPLRDIVTRSLGARTFNAVVLGSLAVLGLLLSAVGIYGVVDHLVGQQTREIGVRMALGASRSNVVALYVRQIAVLVLVGIGLGLAGGFGLTQVLRNMLANVSPTDPWVFVLTPALIFAVALVAALRPALRASAIDPVEALRAE
jgi:predicted permease